MANSVLTLGKILLYKSSYRRPKMGFACLGNVQQADALAGPDIAEGKAVKASRVAWGNKALQSLTGNK